MRTLSIIIAVLIALNTFAQTAKNQAEVKVTMRDGSIYNGTTTYSNVDFVTKYGKLTIPFKNVSSIEIGIVPDKTQEAKVNELLGKILSDIPEVRKSSYEEMLTKSINVVPLISSYLYSEKYVASSYTDYTVEGLLTELQGKYNLSDAYNEEDVLLIDFQYSMGGVYSFKNLELKTEFGALNIPKEKIEKIDVMFVADGDNTAKNFNLNASKFISSNTNGGWLKTGLMVKKGQSINITGSGEVTLQSLSGAKYNPDGAVGTSSTGYEYDDYGYSASTYPTYGNLVYKIGENGVMTKAGSKYNGIATESGIIYISIYETVYNSSNTGSYNVKVKVN